MSSIKEEPGSNPSAESKGGQLPRQAGAVIIQRHRYTLVLATLVVMLCASPFSGGAASLTVVPLLAAMVLLALVVAASRHPRVLRLGVSMVVPILVLIGARIVFPEIGSLALLTRSLMTAVFLLATVLTLWDVLAKGQVDAEKLTGALCVYLLIALLFSYGYWLCDRMLPGAFAPHSAGGEDLGRWLYFSLVTLTTLGYGDVQPVHPAARTMASMEAVMGQLYLAVLVARLVGLHISQSSRETARGNAPAVEESRPASASGPPPFEKGATEGGILRRLVSSPYGHLTDGSLRALLDPVVLGGSGDRGDRARDGALAAGVHPDRHHQSAGQ